MSLALCVDGGEILWRFDLLLDFDVAHAMSLIGGASVVEELFRSIDSMTVHMIFGGVAMRQVDIVCGYPMSMLGGVRRSMNFRILLYVKIVDKGSTSLAELIISVISEILMMTNA